jgi:hypothetical protein
LDVGVEEQNEMNRRILVIGMTAALGTLVIEGDLAVATRFNSRYTQVVDPNVRFQRSVVSFIGRAIQNEIVVVNPETVDGTHQVTTFELIGWVKGSQYGPTLRLETVNIGGEAIQTVKLEHSFSRGPLPGDPVVQLPFIGAVAPEINHLSTPFIPEEQYVVCLEQAGPGNKLHLDGANGRKYLQLEVVNAVRNWITNLGTSGDRLSELIQSAGSIDPDASPELYAELTTLAIQTDELFVADELGNPAEDAAAWQNWYQQNVEKFQIESTAAQTLNQVELELGGPGPSGAADFDEDGDVDGVDFSVFAACFNGAGKPPRTEGCSSEHMSDADFDDDGDVDGVDFSAFASCFNKAGNPPRCP